MLDQLRRVFEIKELREKIVFTLFMLAICRFGGFIPVPGINGTLAVDYFKHAAGGGQNLFQLVDIFSGGAFSQMTVVALGIIPYISASIIIQLFTTLSPSMQREMQENQQAGKRKITQYTRVITILLSVIQSFVFARYAVQMNFVVPGIVNADLLSFELFSVPVLFYLVTIVSMTSGTIFLMWIGEQITENGIGNGISMIITLGILSQLPSAIGQMVQQLNLDSQEPGQLNFAILMVLAVVFVFVVCGTILMIQGHRRIPLQYARRVSSGKHGEIQESSSYIPLKVNYAGVIPVIFASSVLMFPATIAQFTGIGNWFQDFANMISPGSYLHTLLFVSLIVFFTYFWTATQFHPEQIASEMKRNNAFIPGVRQGKATQEYLEKAMNRITIIGALFLALIATLPTIIGRVLSISPQISYFFGGTALLILVGVVLDTMKQVDSYLMMRKYDGFMTHTPSILD